MLSKNPRFSPSGASSKREESTWRCQEPAKHVLDGQLIPCSAANCTLVDSNTQDLSAVPIGHELVRIPRIWLVRPIDSHGCRRLLEMHSRTRIPLRMVCSTGPKNSLERGEEGGTDEYRTPVHAGSPSQTLESTIQLSASPYYPPMLPR
jgi:hypothetical protein